MDFLVVVKLVEYFQMNQYLMPHLIHHHLILLEHLLLHHHNFHRHHHR
jgi:hypothetical protein